jgi:hypothetical protein
MGGHESPVRRQFRHDDQTRDGFGRPTPLFRQQLAGESGLAVDPSDHLLNVVDPRLYLDNKEHTTIRVPSDEIDGSTLAVMTERVLDDHLPSASTEDRGDRFDQPRVVAIAKPIYLSTIPGRRERKPDLERPSDPAQGANRQPFERTRFC